MRRLRLAILLSHPVQYFAPVFRELARRPEIDLTVIYCSLGGARAQFDPGFGRVVQWDTPLLDGYCYKVLRSWWPRRVEGPLAFFAPGALREIGAGNYDALIVFGWAYLTCWLAFAKSRLESLPWMLYGDTSVIYEKEKRGAKGWLRRVMLRWLFRRTSAFLVSGVFNARFYESHGVAGARRFNAPFAVDTDFFGERAEEARKRRNEERRRLGFPPNAFVLLFVGKLCARKRPVDVLDVVYTLRDEFPDIAAALVGDGELRPSLQEYIDQRKINARLLGLKNQSELPAVYAACDVLIVPSWRDPKPLVTNEGMACGLPVIVSDRTGVWGPGDVVRDGENGLVYAAGDVPALTEAVRRLATDKELRERMGRRSREIAEDYTPERCADGFAVAARFACGAGAHQGRQSGAVTDHIA